MSSTVEEFRAHREPQALIPIVLPDGLTIDCRRIDLLNLVVSGLVQWPTLQRMQAVRAEQMATDAMNVDNRPETPLSDQVALTELFVDEWVCAVAVSPRLVIALDEEGASAVWVGRLTAADKKLIMDGTTAPKTKTTVAEFRSDQPPRAIDRPSSEAIRDAPVDAAVGV